MHIYDHPFRILIVGGSGSGKTNALLNLRSHQPDIDKIYLYAKDPFESKYHFLTRKYVDVVIKHGKNPKAFIEYSSTLDDV